MKTMMMILKIILIADYNSWFKRKPV